MSPFRRHPAASVVGVLVLGLALALLGGAPAGAHASLQETDPADDTIVEARPEQVSLRFDEPVSASTGGVQVIGPRGNRVERSLGEADGGLVLTVSIDDGGQGTYTVAYRVVSDDGHNIAGSFIFHVGERTGAATIDQSIPVTTSGAGGIGRWLGYAGAAISAGAALLLVLAHRRGDAGPRVVARLADLVVGGAAASAVGTGLAVLALTATTTGRSLVSAVTLVPEVAGDSRPVLVASFRSAFLVAAVIVGVAARARRWAGGVVGVGVVVALAGLLAPVAGHPWTADPRALAVPVDGVHMLAASVWLGMLVALLAAAPVLADVDAAIRGLSRAAFVAAVVVVVTGAVSGYLLLGSVDALLDTASGQLLLGKVGGFVVLVFLGWLNRTRLVPLLARTATARPRLLRMVGAEVVVGALVLAVTAGLVNQPPGRDVLAQPYDDVRTVDGLTAQLQVLPAKVGDNTLHLYLFRDGQPTRLDALEVTVERSDVPPPAS